MRHLPLLLASAMASLTVGACTDQVTADPAKPAGLSNATPITSASAPKLRPGLWRTRTVLNDGTVDENEECLGPDTDVLDTMEVEDPAACTRMEILQTTGGVSIDALCSSGGMKSSMKGFVSGDFQNTMNVDMTLGLGPENGPMETIGIRSQGRYQGVCEPEA